MADFFSRRERANARHLQVETATSRQSRLQREQAHADKGQPGRRATVFQWVDHNGFRIRTRVPHNSIGDIWDLYGPHDIRYNGWNNEWDVCTEFGDGQNHPVNLAITSPAWSPESPTLSMQGMFLFSVIEPHLNDPSAGGFSPADLMQDMGLNEDLGDNDISLPISLNIFHIAHYRYGFSWSPGITHEAETSTFTWAISKAIYGCENFDCPADDLKIGPLCSFFSGLAVGRERHGFFPRVCLHIYVLVFLHK
jgi:hypothetical protein